MIKTIKSPIFIILAGILGTFFLHRDTLVWIYKAWVYSPFVDGQGPFIVALAAAGFFIRWYRLEDKSTSFSFFGLAVLAFSLSMKILADQVSINTLAALSMCGSIIGVVMFVIGKRAISQFLPFWLILGCTLPTIPYLFDITVNQIFTLMTDFIIMVLSEKLGAVFFSSSPFYFWMASVSYGNYLSSAIFVFSYASFFSLWRWQSLSRSWKILFLLWFEIPIIRLLTASLLTIILGDRKIPYMTTGIYLSIATLFFLITLKACSCKKTTKIS